MCASQKLGGPLVKFGHEREGLAVEVVRCLPPFGVGGFVGHGAGERLQAGPVRVELFPRAVVDREIVKGRLRPGSFAVPNDGVAEGLLAGEPEI